MMPLRTFAPWLLVAFLAQQISFSSSRRGASSVPRGPPKALLRKGDFTNSNQTTCLWHAAQVADSVRIEVECDPGAFNRSGVFRMSCSYTGKPHKCSMFNSNPKMFWKRVERALKKLQVKLCRDERALVQAASCKRSQKDAHFRLEPNSFTLLSPPVRPRPTIARVPVVTVARPTNCTTREDQLRTAEEYCSSWASICSFFLSLVQNDGC